MELSNGAPASKALAFTAAELLGCGDAADLTEILEAAGKGQILDRGSPLALSCVERWVSDVVRAAESREAWRRRQAVLGEGGEDVQCLVDESGQMQEDEAEEGSDEHPEPAYVKVPKGRVNLDYHRGFVAWIEVPRVEDALPRDYGEVPYGSLERCVWADWLGEQLSTLNWRFVAQRKGVEVPELQAGEEGGQQGPFDFLNDPRAAAVERLAKAYDAAGRPMAPAWVEDGFSSEACDGQGRVQAFENHVESLRAH